MIKGKNTIRLAACLMVLFCRQTGATAQGNNSSKYPQGYFGNPLTVPMAVTANFGELRPNHWHMGLDLRTNQKENFPVLAAADGYVLRAGVRALSFGKYLVIRHPNGYSTLYAHLNSFFPELEKYVREKQNVQESWAVELEFTAGQFPVRKADTIALSGNTGGSQGPHLHFEILNSESGRSLNPQLFGFLVADDVPPVINRLALYNRSAGTYLQSPALVKVVKTDSGYFTKPRKILTAYKKISFAIGAYDQVNGSSGANGIYGSVLYYDSIPQLEFLLDNLSYPESDYINAHIDRKYKNSGGPYLQHLSKLPGYRGPVYHEIEGSGIIEPGDTAIHSVKIEVIDANENLSELFFEIQYSDSLAKKIKRSTEGKLLQPGMVNIFEERNFEAFLPDNCLYDTVPLIYYRQHIFPPGSVTARHRFGDPLYPLHTGFYVRINPEKPVPENMRNKIIMTREWQGKKSIRKAEWQVGWLAAKFDVLGIYQAFVDTTAPQINAPVKTKKPYREGKDTLDLSPLNRIVFTPTDNFAVKSFRAELNGKWLMFSNDKARDYVYIFDEQCPYGVHELKVQVEDLAGNMTEKKWVFKRNQPPIPLKGEIKPKTSSKKK